jgi:predicted hotdog family 3-hydroxylacyl-ACP dehydratase
MRFASRPALTIESATTGDATAVTSFDANGHGIVALEIDGQVVQVLATLLPTSQGQPKVRAGQVLRVEEVDGARNRCTVSIL